MTANVDAMVRAGIEAYRANKKAEARKLLEKAIELDDYNEQAWMWLSAVVDTAEERKTCLENVIVINPENEEAKRGLKMLGGQDVSAPAEKDNSSPFSESAFDEIDFTAEAGSSEDWTTVAPTASSSPSASFQGDNLSSSDYDDWVSGLGLSGDSSAASQSTPPPSPSYAKQNSAIDDMFGIEDDDDLFGTDDPFASENLFGDDDLGGTFTSGPFGGGAADDDFEIDTPSTPPARSPKPAMSPQPAITSKPPIKSPAMESSDDSLFDELDSAGFSGGSNYAGGDFFTGEVTEESASSDLSPDEYFSFIPSEIHATRLPGQSEGLPVGALVVTLVLLLLNVGAIAFLVTSLG